MAQFDEYTKTYRSFEDFEREELRRMDAIGTPVDELLDEMFAEELDFDSNSVRKSRAADDDEDE